MIVNSKKEALDLLQDLHQSCQEALDGDWDCTTEEGKEGFVAMQTLIDAVVGYLLNCGSSSADYEKQLQEQLQENLRIYLDSMSSTIVDTVCQIVVDTILNKTYYTHENNT